MHSLQSFPTLPSDVSWKFDAAQGYYVTEPVKTRSIAKVIKNHVRVAATEKHPAQVDVFTEDTTTGHWTKIQFSSEYPATEVSALLRKVEGLQKAVLFAREEANSIVVESSKIGTDLMSYIFS